MKMRNKTYRLFPAVMLMLVMWMSSASAELVVHGPGGRIPDRVFVQQLGEFPLTGGRVDIHALVDRRSSEGGRKIEIPGMLRLFFPSTGSSAAHLVSVSSAAVKNGYVVEIPAVSAQDRILRVFYGPKVVDRTGADLTGSIVWFDGHGGQNNTVSSALLNPSVQMSSGEKQVTAVIWKRGYDISVVPVPLSSEAFSNPELKTSLAKDDIVLNPVKYGVREIAVNNGNTVVHEGSAGSLSYFRDGEGRFGFIYQVKDSVDGKRYSASGMLDDGESSYRLEDYVPERYERNAVVTADGLPSDVPVIAVRNRIDYVARDAGASLKTPGVEKSQFDPALGRLLVFVGAALIALSVIWFLVLAKRNLAAYRMSEQEKQERQLMKMLEYCGIREKRGVLRAVERLSANKLLESSSAAVLRDATEQVNGLLKDLDEKRTHLRKLEVAIANYNRFITESLIQLRDRMKEAHYDIALALKAQIEEAERSRESIQKSRNDLDEVVAKRKAAVVQIVTTMDEMKIRAEALISQVKGVGNLTELGARAKQVMNDLLESFGAELSVDLDPSHIKKMQEERGKAQREGISANDIAALGKFIEDRNNNNEKRS